MYVFFLLLFISLFHPYSLDSFIFTLVFAFLGEVEARTKVNNGGIIG
jgi:hypothetical protein